MRDAVEGFIGQESMHGREHRVLNERLADLGYPTGAIGAYVRWLFRNRERIRSERLHLAFTAALEHYTATLAETLLTGHDARAEIGHEGVRYLLLCALARGVRAQGRRIRRLPHGWRHRADATRNDVDDPRALRP